MQLAGFGPLNKLLSGLEARLDFRYLYFVLRHCCNYVLVY